MQGDVSVVFVLVRAADEAERRDLAAAFQEMAARLTEDEWDIRTLGVQQKGLPEGALLDLICCDVTDRGALEWVRDMRASYRDTMLMLVADGQMSPQQYLRPQIMASSLLLKPYLRRQMLQVVEEFVGCWNDKAPDEDTSLIIKSEQGRVVIPHSRIYYLEAREKKVFVRLLREEYAFYGTLGRLEDELPDYFVKTHRSYVVNGRMIERIRPSDNLITLRDGFVIPLSRSCRANMKGFEK